MSISVLNSPIRQDFSDETDDDIYKCGFMTFGNETCQCMEDAYLSEPIFFEWPRHGVTSYCIRKKDSSQTQESQWSLM